MSRGCVAPFGRGSGRGRRLVLGAVLVPGLFGQAPKGVGLAEILAHVRAVRDATDFRATGRLVRVSAAGERKSYNISIKAHAFAEDLKILCEVTDPPAARVRLLIESRRILEGHAGDAAPKELQPAHWGDALLDSDFSYEDLMEAQFVWKKQTLVEEAACGARMCWVIKSEPAVSDNSHYSQVTTWLDRESYYPVQVKKTLKASKAIKEFVYFDLRQSKGVWSAGQIEAKMQGKAGSSLLIVSRGAEKANLTAAAFDVGELIGHK